MEKGFRQSKKALSALLGASTLIALAWLKAPEAAFWATAAIFGLHQCAQGAQDTAAKWKNPASNPPG